MKKKPLARSDVHASYHVILYSNVINYTVSKEKQIYSRHLKNEVYIYHIKVIIFPNTNKRT